MPIEDRRVLRAGSDGLLVEVAGLEEALALHTSLRDDPPDGVVELVPAARTVLVRFDRWRTDVPVLAAALSARSLAGKAPDEGPLVEVPVCYDGADLAEVAERCGLSAEEVVQRHTAAPWTVAFTGFAPGFGYLSGGDPALDVPRRAEPRTSIPAGSVGLAGRFSGIYPRASPGGWQLIGRTGLVLWDAQRTPPALLVPGVRVQFVDAGPDALESLESSSVECPPGLGEAQGLEVIAPGALTVVEDLGRPGQAEVGVPRSGAVDRSALRRANRLVGNPAGAAALEVAGGGLTVRARGDLVVAVTGADLSVSTHAGGETTELGLGRAFALDDGVELHLGTPDRGLLSYVAVAGGVTGEPVLGSVASDILSGLGRSPLQAGDIVPIGDARDSAAAADPEPGPDLPAADEVTEIEVLLGPRDDWFAPTEVQRFLAQEWTVTPRSNRVGLRLEGEHALQRSQSDELPSEGMVPGAVQVPPSGQPVVFLADHPVTGGYPVIACVVADDLDRVGQVPLGGRIRFLARG